MDSSDWVPGQACIAVVGVVGQRAGGQPGPVGVVEDRVELVELVGVDRPPEDLA